MSEKKSLRMSPFALVKALPTDLQRELFLEWDDTYRNVFNKSIFREDLKNYVLSTNKEYFLSMIQNEYCPFEDEEPDQVWWTCSPNKHVLYTFKAKYDKDRVDERGFIGYRMDGANLIIKGFIVDSVAHECIKQMKKDWLYGGNEWFDGIINIRSIVRHKCIGRFYLYVVSPRF